MAQCISRGVSVRRVAVGSMLACVLGGPAGAGCITSSEVWQSVAFPPEPGSFTFTFDATPAEAPTDAITALTSGEGATFDDFACLIRFNPDGLIDVRNGADYGRDVDVSYGAGQTLDFRVEIDVEHHVYTVFVTPPGEDELLLACGYEFRSSQQGVTSLDHWATWASDGFEHETCGAAADSGDGVPLEVPTDHPTIQAAIDAAVSGDEVVVAPGTYSETIDFKGKHLALRGAGGRDVTTIDAARSGGSVITLSHCEIATIEGLAITGGTSTLCDYEPGDPPIATLCGGGIYSNGSLEITACFLHGNTFIPGDGIFTFWSFGGGLFAHHAVVQGTRFEGNGGATGNWVTVRSIGGGAHVSSGMFADCEFIGNHVLPGPTTPSVAGGLYAGTVEVIDCLFVGNHAIGQSDFGALAIDGIAESCTFINNGAFVGGAGAAGQFRRCVFHSNSAYYGGVIWGYDSVFVNCVLNANYASVNGAISSPSHGGSAPPTFLNCTITNHAMPSESSPGLGPGIVQNCIVWNNEAVVSAGSSVSHSVVQGGWPGEGNIDADPLFVDADGPDDMPGTEDDDFRLSPGSPCIDAGNNGAVPPDVILDLAGNPRFIDDPTTSDTGLGSPPIVDIGAFELAPCAADLNANGAVGFADLVELLLDWGPCPPDPCAADLDGNGAVGFADLTNLLTSWGSCP